MKKGYEIEKLFAYKKDDEDKLTWVPGVVTNVLSRNDEKIVATIKWDEKMIADGESEESDGHLFKNKWNQSLPKQGTWRQDLRHLMLKIE